MSEIIKLNKKSIKLKAFVANELLPDNSNEKQSDSLKTLIQSQYSRGFEEGQLAAKLKLEEEYLNNLQNRYDIFNQITAKINKQLIDYDSAFEELIINISLLVAEKVIRREIDKQSIAQIVLEESIKKVIGSNELIVKLNPADLELINKEFHKKFSEDMFSKIRFESDDRIEKGGCFIESEIGSADGRIASQINELRKKMETNSNRV